jgi:hypothetical protein
MLVQYQVDPFTLAQCQNDPFKSVLKLVVIMLVQYQVYPFMLVQYQIDPFESVLKLVVIMLVQYQVDPVMLVQYQNDPVKSVLYQVDPCHDCAVSISHLKTMLLVTSSVISPVANWRLASPVSSRPHKARTVVVLPAKQIQWAAVQDKYQAGLAKPEL